MPAVHAANAQRYEFGDVTFVRLAAPQTGSKESATSFRRATPLLSLPIPISDCRTREIPRLKGWPWCRLERRPSFRAKRHSYLLGLCKGRNNPLAVVNLRDLLLQGLLRIEQGGDLRC
jgi:hypothetical protein